MIYIPAMREVWKSDRALPQYNIRHARRVAEISSIFDTLPNLHLAGNFLRDRSLGDCVETAFRVADDLHSHLQGKHI